MGKTINGALLRIRLRRIPSSDLPSRLWRLLGNPDGEKGGTVIAIRDLSATRVSKLVLGVFNSHPVPGLTDDRAERERVSDRSCAVMRLQGSPRSPVVKAIASSWLNRSMAEEEHDQRRAGDGHPAPPGAAHCQRNERTEGQQQREAGSGARRGQLRA